MTFDLSSLDAFRRLASEISYVPNPDGASLKGKLESLRTSANSVVQKLLDEAADEATADEEDA